MSDFRLLATGQSLSWLGNGFQTVALAVAIVLAGGGAGDLGLVMASQFGAILVCALFGGVWADRVQPQRVMVLSDAVRCLTAGGLAVMFASGSYHLPLLCGLAALAGGAGAFFDPAEAALKPMLVPAAERQSANATLSLLRTTCSVIGPALGGLTVAAFGAPTGFTVNAVSFIASMTAALLIRARIERTAERTGMVRELAEGWREIRSRDWLLAGIFAATLYHVANGVILVLVQVLAIEKLGGASAAGFISAAEGLGGVAGAVVALRWRPRRLLRAGWLTLALMALWPLAYVWPGMLVAVVAGAILGYGGLTFYAVAWDTAIQDHVPHRLLARVTSWDVLTSFLALPLGNALAGPVSVALGVNRTLVIGAVILLVASLAPLLLAGTRRLRRTGADVVVPPNPAPVEMQTTR